MRQLLGLKRTALRYWRELTFDFRILQGSQAFGVRDVEEAAEAAAGGGGACAAAAAFLDMSTNIVTKCDAHART